MSRDIENAKNFIIIPDESAGIANGEQLVICFRWVDDQFEIHEDFIGLHGLQNTKANSITKVILHVIYRMGVKTENAIGHCYEGAATMSGAKRGVAAQMKSIN